MRTLALALSAAALAACSSGGGTAAAPSPTPSPTPTPHPFTVGATSKPCPVLAMKTLAPLLGPSYLDGDLDNTATEKDTCHIVVGTTKIDLLDLGVFRATGDTYFTGVKKGVPFSVYGLPATSTFRRVEDDGSSYLYFVNKELAVYVNNLQDLASDGIAPESIALLKAAVAAQT